MAFDFFGQGFSKEPTIQFTKQQDEFLKSKLVFLDPKETKNIPIATVINCFTLARIPGSITKKVIQNCKIQGKKNINYDQIKKIFRGISLVQKGIEPSSINISANIKLPMPKFYDDDDDQEEEEEQKDVKPVPPVVPPKNQPSSKTNIQQSKPTKNNPVDADFSQFGNIQKTSQPISKPQIPPPPQSAPQIQQKQSPIRSITQQPINNKIKQFQVYWSKLNTHNNKIDGGQVKNLCKNLAQRSNLSKAWKLCSRTHSGSLTKGQFYVFLELVTMNQLPQTLSEQMKISISQIDKNNSIPKQKINTTQLATTQMFQNFGKSQLNLSVTAPLKATYQPQPQSQPQPQPQLQSQLPERITQALNETTQKVILKVGQASKLLKLQQQQSQQQLLQLRRQQQIMNNMMGQVEQYIKQVNNKNNKIRGEIDELKINQQKINIRFNTVCMGMNQIINKQSQFIDELIHQLSLQNHTNQQKMTVLQSYVMQKNKNYNHIEEQYHNKSIRKQIVQQKNKSGGQKKQREQQYQQKKNIHVQQFAHEQPYKQSHEDNKASLSKTSVENTEIQPKKIEISSQQHHQEQKQVQQQDIQYLNRMKMKQMQVIQLIHYLTPISPQQYPKIAQKITAYSQQQLNYAYTGLYQKLLQKKRQQQQLQKNIKQNKQIDQFNSNNFNQQENKISKQQDFFN